MKLYKNYKVKKALSAIIKDWIELKPSFKDLERWNSIKISPEELRRWIFLKPAESIRDVIEKLR